uniref:40S ribosomal protein SA n=1 Tax=Oncorhynchus kisutch TaxID=8019 RepID=A0A8C7GW44_ONCKI
MSGNLDVLQMKEEDVLKFLAAGTHLGGTNMDFQMEHYTYKRDGECLAVLNAQNTQWNKTTCSVISQAVLKFASATGIQAAFREPRLLIVTDPHANHQPLTESHWCSWSWSDLCSRVTTLRLMWWMLSREVLRMRGTISREHPWEVMPFKHLLKPLYTKFTGRTKSCWKGVPEWTAPAAEFTHPEVDDWSQGMAVPSPTAEGFTDDWSVQPATEDWSAAPTAQASEWVGETAAWS